MVDCIYIAANARDIRFTKICVASVRKFYPDIKIRILRGGPINSRILRELERSWDVRAAEIKVADYGWGFVKLEPLFELSGEKFLILDSDTVMTGPVLDMWREEENKFLVDDEDQTEKDIKRLYYDWERFGKVAPRTAMPKFVFNSGQWFGTAGVLSRDDFAPWINWQFPRTLKHPELFMPGDQGVLNYVLNQSVEGGKIHVGRADLMCWPGHGLDDLKAADVQSGKASPHVVHWAGMKANCHSRMVGNDLLEYFEKLYYQRLPCGTIRKRVANVSDVGSHVICNLWTKIKHAVRKRLSRSAEATVGPGI